MDSGYWQVLAEEEAQERLSLSTPDGKRQCKVTSIGALNAAPTFSAIMAKLQMKWYTPAKERDLKTFTSKIIVYDVLLYGITAEYILAYFRTVLDFLKHHRATLKLKKYKWFQDRCKFVGI